MWNILKYRKTRKILKFLEYGIFQEYSKNCVEHVKYGNCWNMEYSGLFQKMKNSPRGRKV